MDSMFNSRRRINELIEADKPRNVVVQAMIHRLFPTGKRYMSGDDSHHGDEWVAEQLKERRVAHENILRVYLERVVNPDLLASYDAEQAFSRMADRGALDSFMRSLDPTRWEDIILPSATIQEFVPTRTCRAGHRSVVESLAEDA